METNAQTGLVLLLGHPVGHSLSPAMHNRAFRAVGIHLAYVACDVRPQDLPAALEGMRALGVRGANVTLPHKQAAASLLDHVDQEASRIGAINTIVNRKGVLHGHNTDAAGFLAALDAEWGRSLDRSTVLLLGAGGAARAVTAALVSRSTKELCIWNRTQSKAISLCRYAMEWGARTCAVWLPSDGATAARVDLVIHATSAGLAEGFKEQLPDVDIFRRDVFVMDLQYGESPFVAAARTAGLRVADGREMLVRQAGLSFELWTGVPAPLNVMREAAGL